MHVAFQDADPFSSLLIEISIRAQHGEVGDIARS